MTALGIDVGSRVTKLAWREGDALKTDIVPVPRTDPVELSVALDVALHEVDVRGPGGVVVVAVPEQWRDQPDSAAARLADAVQAVVGEADVRLVGTPAAVARELVGSEPSAGRPVVVDAGAGTVEVFTLATESQPGAARVPPYLGLVRHEFDDRSADALKKLFQEVCTPLFGPEREIDVRVVGGDAAKDWVDAAVRDADALGAKLDVRVLDDPGIVAARGALRLAEGDPRPPQRYPHAVTAEVGLRRGGQLVEEERTLVEADRLEVGAFRTHRILEIGEFLRIEGGGVDDLPALRVDTTDGFRKAAPIGAAPLPGRYTADLHLDRNGRCTLLLEPIPDHGGGPVGEPAMVTYGAFPLSVSTFPDDLANDLELIGSWGVRETGQVPRLRSAVEDVRRKLRNPAQSALSQRVNGRYLVDAVLTVSDLPVDFERSAWRIWADHVGPCWKDVEISPPRQGKKRDQLREMWQALCRVDDHLQGLRQADWPSWPPPAGDRGSH